jgi:integrase
MPAYLQIGDKWRVTVRLAGHPQKTQTFALKSQAKQWAENLEHQLRNNKPTEANVTVRTLIDEYRKLRRLAQRPITKESNTYFMLNHLEAAFGDSKAGLLTVANYTNWIEQGLNIGRGRVALGMELNLLKTVYARGCMSLGITLPPHLANATKLLNTMGVVSAVSNKRTRIITDDEHMVLFMNFKKDLYRDAYELIYTLSLRPTEVVNLRWKDYDTTKVCLNVRNRKHPTKKIGNDDLVPLIFNSYAIIERQRKPNQEPEDRIFPCTVENISDAFHKICVDYLIEDCRLYDARHTAITRFFDKKLTIAQVQLLSGHKDLRHLQRYVHLNPESLHGLAELQVNV